jgi:phosphoglycolate phosphatase
LDSAGIVGERREQAIGCAGLGMPLEEVFALVSPEGGNFDGFAQAYLEYYRANFLRHTRPFPGVVDALTTLVPLRAEGLRVAVATTKRTATARRVIDELDMAQFFDGVFGTDGIPHKPAPDLLLLAARSLERDPSSGVMVGDTWRDIAAGRAAKMRTVGVCSGATGRDGFASHPPDWLVDDVAAAVPIVRMLSDPAARS